MKAQDATRGDVGTVESMLDVLASDGVVALLPSARAALEDWRIARHIEGREPSHRTLVLRDNLCRYFGIDPVEEYDTYEF